MVLEELDQFIYQEIDWLFTKKLIGEIDWWSKQSWIHLFTKNWMVNNGPRWF